MIKLDPKRIRRRLLFRAAEALSLPAISAEPLQHQLHHVALSMVRRRGVGEDQQFHGSTRKDQWRSVRPDRISRKAVCTDINSDESGAQHSKKTFNGVYHHIKGTAGTQHTNGYQYPNQVGNDADGHIEAFFGAINEFFTHLHPAQRRIEREN